MSPNLTGPIINAFLFLEFLHFLLNSHVSGLKTSKLSSFNDLPTFKTLTDAESIRPQITAAAMLQKESVVAGQCGRRYRVSSDEFKVTDGATLPAKGHIRRDTVAAMSRSRGSRGGHGTRKRTNVAPEKAVFSQFNTGALKETEKMQKKTKRNLEPEAPVR